MHERLDDYILDIFQNAVEAGASYVTVELDERGDTVRVKVSDNGRGMDPEEAQRALDPFVTDGVKHPSRKVGLGLPFLAQAVKQTGGEFRLDSQRGKGTVVEWSFPSHHWDTPPRGELSQLWRALLNYPGNHELVISRLGDSGLQYEIRRSELIEALGNLEDVGALALLDEYLRSLEEKE
jgi:hypothetical protein